MEKIKWDGITEIGKIKPALLGFITEEEKQQAKKTAYGYFTDIIRKNHRNSGANSGGLFVYAFCEKITVHVGKTEYFMTWNKAAKYICQWLNEENLTISNKEENLRLDMGMNGACEVNEMSSTKSANLTISNKEENIMENQVITQNQEIIITENYSRAVSLHRRICANAQAAQESLFEVCKGLKEMRDGKLYKELGYQNFEDYTQTELGIKRHMAQKYLAIANMENGESIHQIGVTKLALLAKLDEPERQEIIQNTDLESTSVKKLQEEIKRLKADSESQINSMKTRHDTEKADFMREKNELSKKLENKQKEFESKHKEWLESCSENATLTQQLYYAEEERDEAYDTIKNLEKQIQELENRPVEVAVKDDSEEVERLKKQLEQEKQKSAEFEEKKKRIEAELEKDRNSFKSKTPDNSELFEVYYQNCIDSIDKLFAFLRNKNLKSYNGRLYDLSDILNDNISMLDEY